MVLRPIRPAGLPRAERLGDRRAIMQRNEVLALELLKEHRRLLRPVFARHGGHEIKAIGDRFLVEFASSLEAARCAVEIQQTLAERNARGSSERRIEVRIGLHARTGSSVSSQRGPGPRRGYDPIHAVDAGQHRRAIALDKRAPRG